MAIKKLSKEKLQLVEAERLTWLKWQNKLAKETKHSDTWFVYLRERNASYDILMRMTGLTRSRVDDLIYRAVSTATFWLPDGSIRKDHPHE
jgi:hypothetical protein